jgi:hypothetical protein
MPLFNPSTSIPLPVSVANGGTGATSQSSAATNLGLGTTSSPTFAGATFASGSTVIYNNGAIACGQLQAQNQVQAGTFVLATGVYYNRSESAKYNFGTTDEASLQLVSGIISVQNSGGTAYAIAQLTQNATFNTLGATLLEVTAADMDLGGDATGDIYYLNSIGNLTRLGIQSGAFLIGGSSVPQYALGISQPVTRSSGGGSYNLQLSDAFTTVGVQSSSFGAGSPNTIYLPANIFSQGQWVDIECTGAADSGGALITVTGGATMPLGQTNLWIQAGQRIRVFQDSSNIWYISGGPFVDGNAWTANADAGSVTAVIPSTATLATLQTAANLAVSGLGDAIYAVAQKCKALEFGLSEMILPNA